MAVCDVATTQALNYSTLRYLLLALRVAFSRAISAASAFDYARIARRLQRLYRRVRLSAASRAARSIRERASLPLSLRLGPIVGANAGMHVTYAPGAIAGVADP